MLNGPFMIADYSPPVCQSENKTLFEVSTTVCASQNDFKNHSLHQYRILIDFFSICFFFRSKNGHGMGDAPA